MLITNEPSATKSSRYYSTIYSFHLAVPNQQSEVRCELAPLVLGGDVKVQVCDVAAAVSAVIAGVCLDKTIEVFL